MAKEVAVKKRAMIDAASKNMFIAVAAASVIAGITIVAILRFTQIISFNAKVIGEKGKIIADYDTSIKNLPTLASNVQALATNTDLETVAQARGVTCASFEGEAYTSANLLSTCSALRVIPDALPATGNVEALLASLNKIFLLSGTNHDGLSPSDTSVASPIAGLSVIPVNLNISGDSTITNTVLNNIERSIRTFEMGNITIEWRGESSILLRGQATAFYSAEKTAEVKTKTVNADDSKKGSAKK